MRLEQPSDQGSSAYEIRRAEPEKADLEAVRYLSVANEVFPEVYGGLPGHRRLDRLLGRTIAPEAIHDRVNPNDPANVERIAHLIREQHDRRSAILLAVTAEEEGREVGMANFLYGQVSGTDGHWYDGEMVEVNVRKGKRGEKIGAQLMLEGLRPLVDNPDIRQPATVRWDVVEDNTDARAYYEYLGAQPTGGKISVQLFDGTPNVKWVEYAAYADDLYRSLQDHIANS